MNFTDTPVAGAFVMDAVPIGDERGFFARFWSADVFGARQLVTRLDHVSVSFNSRAGTLRGLHFQDAPYAETKLVRCIRGAIFDVAVDLRPDSPTFRKWTGAELTADNRRGLYVPLGCAHGFLTLTDEAEVLYMIDGVYSASHSRGVRWNDPAFGVEWPGTVHVINRRDATYPDFRG